MSSLIQPFRLIPAFAILLGLAARVATGDEPPAAVAQQAGADAGELPLVEKLVEDVQKSVVMISYSGRDGRREGLGTGFIVAAEGLVATNLHVIGEGRPIWVQMLDGKLHEVVAVHASDRAADLAVLRIDAQDLPALALGDSETLRNGQLVVALGNPLGLKHSVVTGVVSGQPEIEGRKMIQLAIPIERGNSGGPLLDVQGRVHGLITMKSAVTANLGFAVPVNRLKPLLEKPNPIPIDRWLTRGALPAARWTTLFGARWRQRGGRIIVEGVGEGFGGRSLCVSQLAVPERPYELAVTVRLDDESGAAGLVFGSDGGERHYGFYPSAGKLRLSRFEGPDVTSWQVLVEQPSPHYRAGDWNTIKVRVEADKVSCYVNDHLAIEKADVKVPDGRVGLAKFRATRGEFKQFRLAPALPSQLPDEELAAEIARLVADIPPTGPLPPTLVERVASQPGASTTVLEDRARTLGQQAAQLRKLAVAVHQEHVLAELAARLKAGDDDRFDLFHAALLIARLDLDDLDVEFYQQEFERLASELRSRVAADADEQARLAALNDFLFQFNGFHGSRNNDYYNRANSYVSEVLDDHEGLPITLSLVYIELAKRIGLNVVGVGLPGHFVVRYIPPEGPPRLLDVFDSGREMTRDEAERRVQAVAVRPLTDEDLQAVGKRAILVRMLHNLWGLAARAEDLPGMLRYLDAVLLIDPDSADDRMRRAFFRYRAGLHAGALEDIGWITRHEPPGINLERVEELRLAIEASQRNGDQ